MLRPLDRPDTPARSPDAVARVTATIPHLGNLDFLRGFAAFYVVLFHFGSRVPLLGLMYHGYLAVDFFYCLSGYVIYRSYHSRIATARIGFGAFMRLRIVRLMPLVWLGNTIAATIDLFRPGNFTFARHAADIAGVFASEALLLPTFTRTTLEDTTYPLNGPIWSLFFELFANIVFFWATRARRATTIHIALGLVSVITMVIAIALVGNAHFGPHPDLFLAAFPRVLSSFMVGVLLARFQLRTGALNRWLGAGLLLLICLTPQITALPLSAAYDIVMIYAVFPLLILASAGVEDQRNDALARASGDVSYALYCIHYPIVRALSTAVRSANLGGTLNLVVCTVLAMMLAGIAWVLHRYYDAPVRRLLKPR